MISQGTHAQAPDRTITLRLAAPADADRLSVLAQLDSTEPPALPVLLAELDGQLVAALALADGAVVADPFQGTIELIALLRTRARQLVRPLTPARPRTALRGR